MKLKLLTLIIALFAVSAAFAHGLPRAVKESIEKRLESGENLSIMIATYEGGETHYWGFGRKSLYSKDKPDKYTIYEIGSITKTFTTIILAEMVAEGKLKLDDPIRKHLPKSVTVPTRNGKEITLKHLANHSSSLPRMPDNFDPADPQNPYVDYTVEKMYEFLSTVELTRDIGSEFEYSNYAMALLGNILARKAGMNYEDLMRKYITDKLGMKTTQVYPTKDGKDNWAKPYNNGREVSNWDLNEVAAAGGIRSNVDEMLKYVMANMAPKASPIGRGAAMTHKETFDMPDEGKIGLGWMIQEKDGKVVIEHGGRTAGYSAFAGWIKGGNKGVVVLSNGNGIGDIGYHILDSSYPLREIKYPISIEMTKIIDSEGLEAAIDRYHDLKKNDFDKYNFGENELNNLGYKYLGDGDIKTAIEIFKLNVDQFPDAFNPYDSLGEAYMENGQKALAIEYYTKSVQLNPGNENGIEMLEKLGADVSQFGVEVEVPDRILQSYVGTYQLAPGFNIVITVEDSKLMAQATAQSKHQIFAKTETEFYYKVVNAQIVFSSDDEGAVEMLTLYQGGQVVPGKKIE